MDRYGTSNLDVDRYFTHNMRNAINGNENKLIHLEQSILRSAEKCGLCQDADEMWLLYPLVT